MRRMKWKRGVYIPRGPGTPTRAWADVSGQWLHSAITAPATATLIQLQSPANLSSLTADPPEDLTVLRVVGEFEVTISGTSFDWILALSVADVTWTPAATIAADNDRRILWEQRFTDMSTGSQGTTYAMGGAVTFLGAAGTEAVAWSCPQKSTIDIKPKVKIEAGKALILAAYEESNGATFTTTSFNMRVLYQRSGRR